MKRKIIILIAALIAPVIAYPQNQRSAETVSSVYNTSIVEIGPYFGQFQDKAASSAKRMEGFFTQKYNLFTEKGRMLRYLEENAFIGIHGKPSSRTIIPANFSLGADVGYAWTYNLIGNMEDRFRLWAGGSLNDNVTLKVYKNYFPTLNNFLYAGGNVVMRYVVGRCRLNATVKIPLATLVSSPGFSIIGPSVMDKNDVATFFDNYNSKFKFFGGAAVDLGISWTSKNGKERHISYRWAYLSSERATTWDFRNATHSLSFAVSIRHRTK